MKRVLVIDDDESLRGLIRRRLSGAYEVFDTGQPEHALALALEHKPDAILLDLNMPTFDGFELCQNFRSLTYTSNLPILVVTGESGKFRKECETLGTAGYFEKPIDFARLKSTLAEAIAASEAKRPEAPGLRIRVAVRLQGIDENGEPLTETVSTESVSKTGFQFASSRSFLEGSDVNVFLAGNKQRYVGIAHITERSAVDLQSQTYRAAFEGTVDWFVQ